VFTLQAPPRDLSVTVRLQDSGQRRTLATFVETGSTTDLIELIARIGTRARTALGDDSTPDRTLVNRSQPGNADAARWFSEGLGKLQPDAVESYERAVAADPDFAPAHIALAEAVYFRDLTAGRPRARAEGARALELARDLPREERLQIEIRAAAMAGGAGFRERTLPAFEKLFELFPDTLQYGFEAALLQVRADPNLALTTIDKIALLPGAPEHFRLHMLEAEAAGAIGNLERATRALAKALKVAEALGDGVAIGDVLLNQARVASDGNDPVTALGIAEAARRQHAIGRPGYFLHSIANATVHEIWYRAGGVAWARSTYDRLIAAARSRGDRTTEGHLRCSLAHLLAEHGELAAAREQWERVVREWQGPDTPRFNPLMGLALVQFRQGELAAARARFAVALDAATPLLPPGGQADRFDRDRRLALRQIAEVLLVQGDLAAARDHATGTLAPAGRDP
jgi:tetratricopeptide (TPR) repeat protein